MSTRFDKKLAHADAMSKRLQPDTTGVKTIPEPLRSDAETWSELKKINDGLRAPSAGNEVEVPDELS